jgi:hypothetical protein
MPTLGVWPPPCAGAACGAAGRGRAGARVRHPNAKAAVQLQRSVTEAKQTRRPTVTLGLFRSTGRRISRLPKMECAADAVKGSAAIVAAIASGDLSPHQAAELSKVIDGFPRAFEAAEFEARLTRLEKAEERKGRTGETKLAKPNRENRANRVG